MEKTRPTATNPAIAAQVMPLNPGPTMKNVRGHETPVPQSGKEQPDEYHETPKTTTGNGLFQVMVQRPWIAMNE
jgi:hypothetical protein